MPRIRKKTSKRGKTHQREKIKQKVRESRKKSKKEAKKNPQWKTKTPKDPGIPNNFPYKDQILAEIAEERAKAEEEKARKKEARKSAKAKLQAEENQSDSEGSEEAFDGVVNISASRLAARPIKGKQNAAAVHEVEEEDVPTLINPELPTLQAVLDQADVVLHILDARDPLPYWSKSLDDAINKKGKRRALVLNKIDACPREALSAWATVLRKQCETFFFRSASAFLPNESTSLDKGKAKEKADDAVGAHSILAFLGKLAEEKGSTLSVAVVGITNSGKSSFINSVARKPIVPIYTLPSVSTPVHGPSTTDHPFEVSIDVAGHTLRFIDTPGLSFLTQNNTESEITRAKDILIRSRGRIDRLKDPVLPIPEIVTRANAQDLILFYNIPVFAKDDTNAFLTALARANHVAKKGGAPDLTAAARIVLRDWCIGKLLRYTTPAPIEAVASVTTSDNLYDRDEQILATVRPRKELRKLGSVRLSPSAQETRVVALDAPWISVIPDEEDEDDLEELNDGTVVDEFSEDEDDASVEGNEEEIPESDPDDEDEDEDEDEEEVLPPPPTGKRKRRDSQPTLPLPSKKVVFARNAQGPTLVSKEPSAPLKSVLKKSTPKVKTKPLKKVSNIKGSKSTKAVPADADAYDFSKFF